MEFVWFFLIVLLIIGFGVYVLFYHKKRFSAHDINTIKKVWHDLSLLSQENPEQAILQADKLLDFALKAAGFQGTLGEKLKKARAVFRDNHGLWSAHKLRNHIAHDIDAHISKREADHALRQFQRAFGDLGIDL